MITLSLPITEASQIADARRRTAEQGRRLSLGDVKVGQLQIIVTELATNLVKFAREGVLLISSYEDEHGEGIELLALDKGPGMASVARCLEDGYSTAGSAGTGLGAVGRLAHGFAIESWPDGTIVMARIGPGSRAHRGMPLWSKLEVPMRGEEMCGDAICARYNDAGWTIVVADGLGHGPQAATAAVEALLAFRRVEHLPPGEVLTSIHEGMRHTRGAAVAVARLDRASATLFFAGIGNIVGVIVTGHQRRQLVSLAGTAGANARRITTFDYPFPPGSLLVMHSDGLSSSWSLESHPGLVTAHPAIVAGVLLRDHARMRDDASVIVARSGRL